MANQSEKKAAERVKIFSRWHGGALLIILSVYAIVRIGFFYSSWSTSLGIFFFVCALIEYWCYSVLYGHLEAGQLLDGAGGLVEPCRDILYVMLFSQVVSLIFGDSSLWIMGVIPVVAFFKLAKASFNTWGTAKEDESVEALSKTQQKKLKKIEKFGHR
jgi:hypothetical protein